MIALMKAKEEIRYILWNTQLYLLVTRVDIKLELQKKKKKGYILKCGKQENKIT